MALKKVLIFIDWYLPGYKAGGQIASLANLVNLTGNDYKIFIVTRDRDLGDTVPYPNIDFTIRWHINGNTNIHYVNESLLNLKYIRTLLKEISPDVIYFNSLFSLRFTLLPLFQLKISHKNIIKILGPRGMLGEGALKQKSSKKKFFLFIAKALGFYKGVIWHASSDIEKKEIEKIFSTNQNIRVALDLAFAPKMPDLKIKVKKNNNELRLFFLSRISPKKNLKFCIETLYKIKPSYQIKFSVIGPVEDEKYWQECLALTKKLSNNIVFKYLGEIPNNDVHNTLAKNFHFFFFPTLHENFGHVIAESMFAGRPVIISDRTPWRNLSEIRSSTSEVRSSHTSEPTTSNIEPQASNQQHGIGWDLPLEHPERFVEVIEHCARMGQEEYDAMSQRAFAYAKQVTEDPEVVEANRRLFL